MKRFLFLLWIGLNGFSPLAASADGPPVGTISRVDGPWEVLVQTGISTHTAKVGEGLQEHDRVATKADQTVVLVLKDQSEISLGPSSSLQIDKFVSGARNTTILNALYGLIRTVVNRHYREDEIFALKTPSGVMGVRGTQFLTEVNQQTGMTKLDTLSGKVAMAANFESLKNPSLVVMVGTGMSSSIQPGMSKPQAVQASNPSEVEKKLKHTQVSANGAGSKTQSATKVKTAAGRRERFGLQSNKSGASLGNTPGGSQGSGNPQGPASGQGSAGGQGQGTGDGQNMAGGEGAGPGTGAAPGQPGMGGGTGVGAGPGLGTGPGPGSGRGTGGGPSRGSTVPGGGAGHPAPQK